ncbi:MAG: type II toxin-antitoxin system MqsA family antitoxin [Balneolaceae bacterium]|nr:type II toxin-antitoxin system MqsA family antitoxin [Balneolaceae bacterium]
MYECKLCGGGNGEVRRETEQVRYRGTMLAVPLAYCVCMDCGEEFVPTELVRQNDAAFRAAKRHFDGLLAPEEIREARIAMGLTQEEASRVFGGGANAFSKYERGEVTQSVAMDRLVRLCRRHPELLEELRTGLVRIADLEPR